jgi:UDP-N-acetyl-D-glucosamine dehydrogenase
MHSVPLDAQTLATADAVLIATEHSSVDYDLVLKHAKLVVDTRGVFRKPKPNVVKA